ncbi:MAG: hypothetical protein ACI4VN_02925 [Clostridia bacterium]
MKRIGAFLLTLLLLLTTGCSTADSNVVNTTRVDMLIACRDANFQYGTQSDEHYEMLVKEKANQEVQELFWKLCDQEKDYINEKYGLNFKSEHIPVYVIDMDSVDSVVARNGLMQLYAAYIQNMNAVIINKAYLESEVTDFFIGILAHEAGHYLYYENNGTNAFLLREQNDGVLGMDITEGVNHKIILDFLEENYPKACDSVRSTYLSNVLLCNMLECVIPDLDKLYLENDIEAFCRAIDEDVLKYTTATTEIATPSEYLMFQSTLMFYFETLLLDESLYEQAFYGMYQYAIADLEIIYAMARDLSESEREELEKAYEEFVEKIFYGQVPEGLNEQLALLENGK